MTGTHSYFLKPYFDIIVSIILLPLILPIIFLIGFVLIIPNKGRIFFLQFRTGKNGIAFKVIKFRTLSNNKSNHQTGIICYFLRESHLDELPQIFNVLMGNMSLVGPRPLLPEYQYYYDSESAIYRNTVKPGITGLTQISGGKYLPWAKRFSLDLFYIHHVSFFFDLLIICRTLIFFYRSQKTTRLNQTSNDISFIEYSKRQNKT